MQNPFGLKRWHMVARIFASFWAVIAFTLVLNASPANAAHQCPTFIGYLDSPASIHARNILKKIYADIGCAPFFEQLPGRRSLEQFNASEIDGEVIRLSKITESYTKPIVQSRVPVVTLNLNLYRHPEERLYQSKPLAYTMGVFWEEKFAEGFSGALVPTSNAFNTFELYRNEKIGQFLNTNLSVDIWFGERPALPKPILLKTTDTIEMYHHLDQKFAVTMEMISNRLAKQARQNNNF